MRCYFNMVVWGDEYIRRFFDWSLPTLLAKGNLDGFPFLGEARFIFMTMKADWDKIHKSSQMKRIEKLLDVEPVFIDKHIPDPARPEYNHKYIRVSLAQSEFIRAYADQTDCLFFLYPDFIYSAGSLSRVAARMDEGYEAVCAPMPFVLQEAVDDGAYEQFGKVTGAAGRRVATLEPRQLVDLACKHPHPVMRGFNMAGDEVGEWPGYFMWPVNEEGWLIHAFHWHPVALRPRPHDPAFFKPFELSLDDEFVSKVYYPGENIYFPTDSDEIAICSLRGEASPPHPVAGKRSALLPAVRWAEQYAGLTHRWFLSKPFRWHHAELTEADWTVVEARARAFVDDLRHRLNVPDMVLSFEDPVAYAARQRRKLHFAQVEA